MPNQVELSTWRARTQKDLKGIWRKLVGEPPTFRKKNLSPAESGYVFERWIIECLRLSKAEFEPPFEIPINPVNDERAKHQLDGLLIVHGQAFLIESKFQHVDFGPIARLHVLTEAAPVGTMGLLFAAKGYTPPALNAIEILRPIRVLLFDRLDIETILAAKNLNFAQAVRSKWKAAIMFGSPSFLLTEIRQKGKDT
jgi:hypothetical protein